MEISDYSCLPIDKLEQLDEIWGNDLAQGRPYSASDKKASKLVSSILNSNANRFRSPYFIKGGFDKEGGTGFIKGEFDRSF